MAHRLSPRSRSTYSSRTPNEPSPAMSSNPVTQFSNQITGFLFGGLKYTPREAAIIIAVLNLKGGCGKSTIAVNLACELASSGSKVLLVDNDSQGTATHWLRDD